MDFNRYDLLRFSDQKIDDVYWENYLRYQPNIFREGNHMSWVSKTLITFVLGYILVKI